MKRMGLCNHNLWVVHQLAILTQTLVVSASNPFRYINLWEWLLSSKTWARALYKLVWHWKHLMHWCGLCGWILLLMKLFGVMSHCYEEIWGTDDVAIWYTCMFPYFDSLFYNWFFDQYFNYIISLYLCGYFYQQIMDMCLIFQNTTWLSEWLLKFCYWFWYITKMK